MQRYSKAGKFLFLFGTFMGEACYTLSLYVWVAELLPQGLGINVLPQKSSNGPVNSSGNVRNRVNGNQTRNLTLWRTTTHVFETTVQSTGSLREIREPRIQSRPQSWGARASPVTASFPPLSLNSPFSCNSGLFIYFPVTCPPEI